MKIDKELFQQGLKYVISGMTSAAVELVFFSALYYLLRFPIGFASPISLVISTMLNYILNSRWSFKGSSNMRRSTILYFTLFAFNTCFSSFASQWLATFNLQPMLIKVITMACIVCWNFILYRKVIFI